MNFFHKVVPLKKTYMTYMFKNKPSRLSVFASKRKEYEWISMV